MRKAENVVFEKEDYEALKNMSREEIIKILHEVDDGWFAVYRYFGQDGYEGDAHDYEMYRISQALTQAAKFLSKENGK